MEFPSLRSKALLCPIGKDAELSRKQQRGVLQDAALGPLQRGSLSSVSLVCHTA